MVAEMAPTSRGLKLDAAVRQLPREQGRRDGPNIEGIETALLML